ncbi:MAG: hypothetical protein WDO73_11545 [Ignavibacteriota bacterium]
MSRNANGKRAEIRDGVERMERDRARRDAAMKLTLHNANAEQAIEIAPDPPSYRFRLGDAPERSADVLMPEPGVYSVLLDGRVYDARVEETPSGLVVVIDGYRFEIDVHDPRRWNRRDASRGVDGVQTVVAPMPARWCVFWWPPATQWWLARDCWWWRR